MPNSKISTVRLAVAVPQVLMEPLQKVALESGLTVQGQILAYVRVGLGQMEAAKRVGRPGKALPLPPPDPFDGMTQAEIVEAKVAAYEKDQIEKEGAKGWILEQSVAFFRKTLTSEMKLPLGYNRMEGLDGPSPLPGGGID